jgi:hypothetical protein
MVHVDSDDSANGGVVEARKIFVGGVPH